MDLLRNIYRKIFFLLSESKFKFVFNLVPKNRFLVRLLRKDHVYIFGKKLYLDKMDSLGLSVFGEVYEKGEHEVVKKLVRKNDVVADVGAHIGFYTILFSNLVGERGRVFAFEPDPTNFGTLKRNIKANNIKNVTLINKAVSNKNGITKLFLSEYNLGSHTIYKTAENKKWTTIKTIRLDDFCKKNQIKFDFIKMDIEGSEPAALESLEPLINEQTKLTIISEFLPEGIKKFGYNPAEYLKKIKQLGFKIYEINDFNSKLKRIEISGLLKRLSQEKNMHANILCVKDGDSKRKDAI